MLLVASCAVVAWMLLGTAAARDADARGQEGRWVGVAWVLCFPLGVALWLNARRFPRQDVIR